VIFHRNKEVVVVNVKAQSVFIVNALRCIPQQPI
jgi:hypothetical protein